MYQIERGYEDFQGFFPFFSRNRACGGRYKTLTKSYLLKKVRSTSPFLSMSQKNILVTGATGRQEQAFISALRDCDYFHILALTRNRSSRKAKWLASASKVTIIERDLDSEAFIRSVFEGRKVRMLNPMAAASGFSGARR